MIGARVAIAAGSSRQLGFSRPNTTSTSQCCPARQMAAFVAWRSAANSLGAGGLHADPYAPAD
eukprot:1692274-Alexandrium_andersonii.AAC.1